MIYSLVIISCRLMVILLHKTVAIVQGSLHEADILQLIKEEDVITSMTE